MALAASVLSSRSTLVPLKPVRRTCCSVASLVRSRQFRPGGLERDRRRRIGPGAVKLCPNTGRGRHGDVTRPSRHRCRGRYRYASVLQFDGIAFELNQ